MAVGDEKRPTDVPAGVCEFGNIAHRVEEVDCEFQWWGARRAGRVTSIFGNHGAIW